jgi:hypothetical protein
MAEWDASGRGAQEHLDKFQTKYDLSMLEAEREQSHAKHVPRRPEYPDCYSSCEDVTVTVDPMKNAAWIRDDSHAHRSAATIARGALKDHKGVMRAARLLDRHPAPPRTFMPTSSMLDRSLKLSARCVANSTHGMPGNSADKGRLPTFSQMIWQNRLGDKPDWRVEAEVWAESNHGRDRRFDCGGMCR